MKRFLSPRRLFRQLTAPRPEPQPGLQIVEYLDALFYACPDYKIESALSSGTYDDANLRLCQKLIRPGHVCIDVGANAGVYTVLMARWASDAGQVHAFEPVAHVRQRLLRNVRLNRLAQVRVEECAVGAAPGIAMMHQVRPEVFRAGTSSLVANENIERMTGAAFDQVEVAVTTLDAYAVKAALTRVDFIKLDVEGYELECLRGAAGLLGTHRPLIFMEHNQERLRHLGRDEQEIARFFQTHGYRCFEPFLAGDRIRLRDFSFDRPLEDSNLLGLPWE